MQGFRKQHSSLRPRQSEIVSRAAANVTEGNIRGWFENFQAWLVDNGFDHILHDPSRIFGGDKTAFHLSPRGKPVVAEIGSSYDYDVENNAQENVTVLFTFGASGTVLKPFIVYEGKRRPVNNWGNDAVVSVSANGWMISDL